MSQDFEASLIGATLGELVDGPLTFERLVVVLRRRGALGSLEPYDDDQVSEELDIVFGDTDDIWSTDDGFIAATASMLSGTSFSHELTAAELERNALELVPDFTALDFNLDDGLALTGGGRLHNEMEHDLDSDRDDLVGPPGWLKDCSPGQLIVISRIGGTATLHPHPSLGSGEREAQALLASFEWIHEEGLMDDVTQVVLDSLCRDHTLFRSPVPSIGELLTKVGLECDGEWLSRRGEEAEPPGVIYRRLLIADLTERFGFDRCCTTAFEFVLEAWSQFVLHGADLDDARSVAQALAHDTVAPAFSEYVLGDGDVGSRHLEELASALVRLSGKLRAPGHYLLALNAERDGRTIEAEHHLKLATLADAAFNSALRELAWYESDRGHLSAAISLLRRAGFEDGDPPIDDLEALLDTSSPKVGRNDPCPCGSGRKYKVCCLNDPTLTSQQLRQALHHKIMQFAFRPQHQGRVRELFDIAMHFADEERGQGLTPFLMDLAVYNTDALARFDEARGPLLTDTERSLVLAWIGARRSLWQVLDVDPGTSMRLLDTCTGDGVDVSEQTASQTLHVGDYIFARLIEEGPSWAFESEILLVPLQHRASLIELLDEGGDPLDFAAWLGQMFGPIRMVNYEGDDIVMCRAVLAPTRTSWTTLSSTLDRQFETLGDDRWNETIEGEESPTVRCFLSRVDDTLVVVTNSVERLERVLALLRNNVTDLEVVEDERTDVATARARALAEGHVMATPEEVQPAEVLEVVQAFVRKKEEEWIDEPLPALAGLTPREAANDPTRREDLVALLNEFDRRDSGESGFVGFDVARLRQSLDVRN